MFPYFIDSTALVLGVIFTLLFSWVLGGFAIKIAASAVANRKISIGRGMIIAFISIIIFAFLFFVFSFLTPVVGFIVGLLGMIYVIKFLIGTGWISGFLIAIIAWIILAVIYFILSFIFLFPLHFPSLAIPGY
ncbi:MAG: hypothetical protein ACYDAP_06100 [Thermoplasmataceae archaeon]